MSLADFMLSKRQQNLLAPLLMRPGQSHNVNELIKLSGAGTGAGQTAIQQLLAAGVLVSQKMGNQVRIEANQKFPLYPELRRICMKSFGLAEAIKQALVPLSEEIEKAFVFGSLAAGTDKSDSDVDLMVIGTVPLMKLNDAIYKLEQQLARPIHVNKHSPTEWATVQDDPIIQQILSQPIIPVIP